MRKLNNDINCIRVDEKFIYTYKRTKNDINGNATYSVAVIDTVTLEVGSFSVTAYKYELTNIVKRYLIEKEGN